MMPFCVLSLICEGCLVVFFHLLAGCSVCIIDEKEQGDDFRVGIEFSLGGDRYIIGPIQPEFKFRSDRNALFHCIGHNLLLDTACCKCQDSHG